MIGIKSPRYRTTPRLHGAGKKSASPAIFRVIAVIYAVIGMATIAYAWGAWYARFLSHQ